MNCPYCASNHIRKNGHRRRKQNYICVNCDVRSAPQRFRQFIKSYSKRGYNDEIKEQCLTGATRFCEVGSKTSDACGVLVAIAKNDI